MSDALDLENVYEALHASPAKTSGRFTATWTAKYSQYSKKFKCSWGELIISPPSKGFSIRKTSDKA